jgi:hypothetical protein
LGEMKIYAVFRGMCRLATCADVLSPLMTLPDGAITIFKALKGQHMLGQVAGLRDG